MKVLVLGCGPAGLLAAHAAAIGGADVRIVSQKRKSRTGGAMWLHEHIPHVTTEEPDGQVTYLVQGESRTYARKVYGSASYENIVSFDRANNGMKVDAWDLVPVYDILWDMYESYILHADRPVEARDVVNNLEDFKLVISTIPRPSLCKDKVRHKFQMQNVLITNESVWDLPEGTVLYDGTTDVSWYRCSNIFGRTSTEWSRAMLGQEMPPLPGAVEFSKPFMTECTCWDHTNKVTMTGRYGAWDKRKLVTDAYRDAVEVMEAHGAVY